jgi:putative glutamine amidotransferase
VIPLSKNHPPIIGLTTRNRDQSGGFQLSGLYLDAVRATGGVPVLLTPGETQVDVLVELLDGLILTGGGDISPQTYGGEDHPHLHIVCTERDAFECALAKAVLRGNLPTLGICRGMQLLNVVCGGRLHPHVPEAFGEVDHFCPKDRKPIRHDVCIVPDTQLAEIIQESPLSVVSWHHQAICSVPPGWRIAAHSHDDLIEAIEHQDHPWAIGIQWHPEFSASEPGHRRLFQGFMEAVVNHQNQRILS